MEDYYNTKRLALILAVQAEIEGMKFGNLMAEQCEHGHPYSNDAFIEKADELRMLANARDHQLDNL